MQRMHTQSIPELPFRAYAFLVSAGVALAVLALSSASAFRGGEPISADLPGSSPLPA